MSSTRVIGLSLQETRFVDKLSVSETLRSSRASTSSVKIASPRSIGIVGLEEKKKS